MYYIINGKVEKTDSKERIAQATDTIPEETMHLYWQNNSTWKIENGKFIKLKTETEVLQLLLRHRREMECFPIINRGALWYEKLTEEQKTELSAWYEAWLDAPATSIIPDMPTWLK